MIVVGLELQATRLAGAPGLVVSVPPAKRERQSIHHAGPVHASSMQRALLRMLLRRYSGSAAPTQPPASSHVPGRVLAVSPPSYVTNHLDTCLGVHAGLLLPLLDSAPVHPDSNKNTDGGDYFGLTPILQRIRMGVLVLTHHCSSTSFANKVLVGGPVTAGGVYGPKTRSRGRFLEDFVRGFCKTGIDE